ncbi:helix-turn-helix domain-containing protein [Vibrio quintilis]|uniref:Bacteriophage CI repressor helix-turn-helix domain protein n=1 Tax=Vibrio quintilis TaxID=1117707 RepID=A0A1M7Z0X9_9VIBR|nr:helix-turn-helix domain-containing protein [Vibrio quintilis]SHO58598.1 Bacteriophage CI repressor helix-turn-helix domain protein [Vibrio quintilis]
MSYEKVKTYDYLKGTDFTKNLKKLTRRKNYQELSRLLDIPKSTFSTWNRNQRTPYEVIARVHLAMHIPVKELALPQHIPATEIHPSLQCKRPAMPIVRDTENNYEILLSEAQHTQWAAVLHSFPRACPVSNAGSEQPQQKSQTKYNTSRMIDAVEIETQDYVYLINREMLNIGSGRFLIDINGKIYIQYLRKVSGHSLLNHEKQALNDSAAGTTKILGYVIAMTKKTYR